MSFICKIDSSKLFTNLSTIFSQFEQLEKKISYVHNRFFLSLPVEKEKENIR